VGKRGRDEPEVELLFEGDLNARPVTPLDTEALEDNGEAAPNFHSVGADPLAKAVSSVADSLAAARTARSEAAAIGMANQSSRFSDLLPERTAQVVQATRAPARHVIQVLRARVDGEPFNDTLWLTGSTDTGRNDVGIFEGSLAMRWPSTRRRIELRVYPTSSGNLTVLELLPKRIWMPQTRRYLAAGIPAISAMTRELSGPA